MEGRCDEGGVAVEETVEDIVMDGEEDEAEEKDVVDEVEVEDMVEVELEDVMVVDGEDVVEIKLEDEVEDLVVVDGRRREYNKQQLLLLIKIVIIIKFLICCINLKRPRRKSMKMIMKGKGLAKQTKEQTISTTISATKFFL